MSDTHEDEFTIEAHGTVTNPPDDDPADDGASAEGTVTNPEDKENT